MKNKIGGVEITYCSCGQGSLGCYGQVQCDCTNPKFPRCAPIGKTLKKTPTEKNINRIRKKRCRKTYISDQMKLKNVKRLVLDQPMYILFLKEKKKHKKVVKHKTLEKALRAATLKKTLPHIKTIKEGLYQLKRFLKSDSKCYYIIYL